MKPLVFLTILGLAASPALADSTIDAAQKYAYGANIGWINWKHDLPAPDEGAVVGLKFLSGHIYGANVGWIDLGDGTPDDSIAYSNASATDYGVNVTSYNAMTGMATLEGNAYGANIGWLTFEQTYGMPKFNPLTGEFSGSCYSANCGWITLANGAQPPLKTGTIDCGPDSDGDGIPDWWELERLAAASKPTNLATLSDTTDSDGDGTDDLAEFLADTDPFDVTDFLRITTWTLTPTVGTSADVTVGFPTTTSRLYDLEQVILTTPGTFAPVPGGSNLAGTGGELMVTDPGVDLSVIPDYYTRVIVKIPLKP